MISDQPRPRESGSPGNGSSRFIEFGHRIVQRMLRLGLPVGPIQLLTLPGRKSGTARTIPVTPMVFNGEVYLQAYTHARWVLNARAASWATMGRGRRMRPVRLVELTEQERVPILLELARRAPSFVTQQLVREGFPASPDPEAVRAVAPRWPVFRVDDAANDGRTALTRCDAGQATHVEDERRDG